MKLLSVIILLSIQQFYTNLYIKKDILISLYFNYRPVFITLLIYLYNLIMIRLLNMIYLNYYDSIRF